MADAAYDYDLFVIGAGSGGVRAARIAAQSGARVAIAEEYRIGGTCVIRGCVPKKFMVYASDYGRKLKEARDYGWQIEEKGFDFETFMSAMHAEVDRLSGIYLKNLANAGVDVFEERAELSDAHTVVLKESGKTFTVDKVLIATGGTPWRPAPEDLPGVEHTITSNEVFQLESLPKHIVIAGGGYIACEFAHIFAGLGVETCLVYRGDTVLNGFDWDVRTAVHEGLKEAGVRVVTSAVFEEIREVEGEECPYCVKLSNGMEINADTILMAVGRRAATEGLGCDAAGVNLSDLGAIIVDDESRTSVPNIFAVGDVTDRIQLTPVAIREGHAFADTIFGDKPWSFEHDNVASAVFTQPEVGTVGMTEAEARKAFKKVDIYKTRFRPMKTMLLNDPERVMIKLVVNAEDDRVVGVHIVSPDAGEMIQMIGVAVKMGATKAQFDATCAVHPTIAEEIVTLRQKWVPDTEPA
ncbi:MAG: glutathione-disulfide reductase [Henriciella sp.]|jgi:glutathione reductase (NADPH)|uniref:glutathione-disulfide reductase n=1 Tax=Henriciella sp. TaxID=1968823 RepID=UPI000C0E3956|nr:glutathione-disulfide reductase [Henriciella sp.]MAN73800.1 glutathione-disulfide reductase [Henriciella sp.]MBF35523.1 glutathione-disulfide reductase [Hyphomonadaceae bacterium]MBK75374.1 glutathione-disulfide reductase [Henriciella sp.]PHR82421.1 MAG: glutathione-disulfide reductase [Henriciella sp.]|tara:strand:+ start:1565 stop:2965 length:1401 start_codon:yes stop_codon:yes gene_type:complete